MDKKLDETLDEKLKAVLDAIWKNWAFRLSLSSNELFHSNILQYLAEGADKAQSSPSKDGTAGNTTKLQEPENHETPANEAQLIEPTYIDVGTARNFMSIFCDEDVLVKCKEKLDELPSDARLQVLREVHKIDLTLMIPTAKENKKYKPLFALEVKVKAYPEAKQLARHRKYLNSNWLAGEKDKQVCVYQPPLVLLTGMGLDDLKKKSVLCDLADSKASQKCEEPTYGVGFARLATRLHALKFDSSVVGAEYTKLCSLLDQLFNNFEKRLNDSFSFEHAKQLAKKLSSYRLDSLWWKLWAGNLAQACRDKVSTEGIATDSGFTHQGYFSVSWEYEGQPKKQSINIGLQIQGDSLRFYLKILDPSLGAPGDARLAVERCLLILIRDRGIFACVPGIRDLVGHWKNVDHANSPNQKTWNDPALQLMEFCEERWPKQAKLLEGELGRPTTNRPMLTGYANGQGNGFADLRLKIKETCTRSDLVALVHDVLIEDVFSRDGKGKASLLKAVVDDFKNAEDKVDWIRRGGRTP